MRRALKSKNRGHTDSIEITCHLVVRRPDLALELVR
jgi:hypothetical protein